MKHIVKKVLHYIGIEIRKVQPGQIDEVGTDRRPIGNIRFFLEDIARRGFVPQGILDVGANRGEWTEMAKHIFPEVAVIMIEPQDEMRGFLQKVTSRLGHVEWIQAGAGATKGEMIQTIWKDLNGSSFVPKPGDIQTGHREQRISPIVTIDGLLSERPHFVPDLVKMDIQGFEVEALKGAESIFGKTELFILETSLFRFLGKNQPITHDIISFMHEKGYEIYDITEFLRRPSD
ncbi:MAG TPA: hypothetical protein DIW24_00460, partial [Bacteroidetes bacterium]|nr:hypothetical protein [Bacteroidota bacterium]